MADVFEKKTCVRCSKILKTRGNARPCCRCQKIYCMMCMLNSKKSESYKEITKYKYSAANEICIDCQPVQLKELAEEEALNPPQKMACGRCKEIHKDYKLRPDRNGVLICMECLYRDVPSER